MPPRNSAPVQVPGEAPQAPKDDTAVVVDSTTPEPAPDETVAVPKVQLDALLARVAALESSAKAATVSRVANPEAELPDAASVDMKGRTTPVLTKQGWLVPDTYGANPNAPKAF